MFRVALAQALYLRKQKQKEQVIQRLNAQVMSQLVSISHAVIRSVFVRKALMRRFAAIHFESGTSTSTPFPIGQLAVPHAAYAFLASESLLHYCRLESTARGCPTSSSYPRSGNRTRSEGGGRPSHYP